MNNDSSYGENDSLMYDFSGSGNNGTCSGSNCPNWTSDGKLGGAFDFDGTDDYIELLTDAESDAFENDDSWTWMGWVKSESTSGNSIVQPQRPLLNQDGKFFDDNSCSYITLRDILKTFLAKVPEVVSSFEKIVA